MVLHARCRPGLYPRRGSDPAARAGAAYKTAFAPGSRIPVWAGAMPPARFRSPDPAARARAAYKIQARCGPGLCPRRNEPSNRIGRSPSPPQGFDLPREWPIVRLLNQSRTYGIHPHVIPFFRIAFAAAQQMVEKAVLPGAAQLFRFAFPARCRPEFIDPAARAGAAYNEPQTAWLMRPRPCGPGLCPRRRFSPRRPRRGGPQLSGSPKEVFR